MAHAEYMSRELTLMLRRMRRRRWSGLPLLLRVVLRMRNVGDQPGKEGREEDIIPLLAKASIPLHIKK